ncbi:MAG: SRPBCC family protein [Pseudomonadota bacterium]
MRLLKNIVLGLLGLVVLVALGSFLLPRVVTVERTVTIDAPASSVFPLVNSMQRTVEWSPWLEKDPNVVNTFSGPDSGVGNKMAWASDQPDVGNGTQEIVESVENQKVTTALDFGAQGLATAEFLLNDSGTGTDVTWTLITDTGFNPMARIFGTMLDGFIGPDYEKGLANLKAVAESS